MTANSANRVRIWLGIFCAGATATLVAQSATTVPPFTETIEVREVEVLFEIDSLPRFESIGRRGIEDFAAFEGGASHDLIELGSTSAGDFVHVLYFDVALAGPAARIAAAKALAERAVTLTAGGRAELLVADPRPRLLVATSVPEMLQRALAEIVAAAYAETAGKAARSPAGVAARAQQLDRLLVELAGRGGGGARALWLPVDGWPLTPAELERYSRARAQGNLTEPVLRALMETGRTLAGYGWVTFPVAIRAEREELSPRETERRMQVDTGGSGDTRTTFPVFTISGTKNHPDATSEAQLSTLTDFSLAPLAELSRATSGTLVGHPRRLRSAMDDLVGRRRATYRGPVPEPGTLRPLEIRWIGGDGRPLPAPRFLRASTPPEVSTARLRALLAGDSPPKSDAMSQRSAQPSREVCFGEGEERQVRISVARLSGEGRISIELGTAKRIQRKAAGLCAPLITSSIPSDARLAWIAEDLDNETWTGGVEQTP